MIKRSVLHTATLAICFAVLVGCNAKQGSETKQESKASTGQVLAEVGSDKITTDDFKKEVEGLPPYLKPMTETADGKKELLETMVIRELILQDAEKAGVDKSQAVLDKLADLKKRLVVEAYLKQKVDELAKVSDDDLKKFYDQNKDKFKTGEQIRASHILVKSDKEAQDILAQLKKGASFEELAKKYSTDGAAAKGGDLGWFSKGSMIPDFEKVAFGLKEGQISGVVKTKFGYHIIKLTGKRPAGIRTFDEVKDQIKAALMPQKQQEVFQKLKDELKKSGRYTIKEDALKALGGTPGGEAAEASVPPAGTTAPEQKK